MKMSIYAGPSTQQAVADAGNVSGRIERIAERYLSIIRHDCPAFTESEWFAICDALSGVLMEGSPDRLRTLWAAVADADRFAGLGEKWGVNAAALAERLRAMSMGGLCAIAEVVQRFWQRSGLPPRDALIASGAKIADSNALGGHRNG